MSRSPPAKPARIEDLIHALWDELEQVDHLGLVERRLRRKLLMLRRFATGYASGPELQRLLGRVVDEMHHAVLFDEKNTLLGASAAVERITSLIRAAMRERCLSESELDAEPATLHWWERARATEHWSGDARFFHHDGRISCDNADGPRDSPLQPLLDWRELEAALTDSEARPVWILKHREWCGVSAHAFDELTT